jgi:hypothetical protein
MELILLVLLMLKHTVADYMLQYRWMWEDKAYYGKFGGLVHAGFHGALTSIILLFLGIPVLYSFALGLLDAVAHYHIDYVKSNWIRKNSPIPNSQMYWIMHGIDQFLHFLTYVAISTLIQ